MSLTTIVSPSHMRRLSSSIVLCGILYIHASGSPPGTTNYIEGSYCSIATNPCEAELQPRGKCLYEVDGEVFALPKTIAELNFSQGLPAIGTKEFGWLFVKKDGTTVRTIHYDNGPDTFSEGMARYVDCGKIGFIDASGTIVIKARFRFAGQFKIGHAPVCDDFVLQRLDEEHKIIRSHHWGCIDTRGKLVLPMKYSDEELQVQLKQIHKG